MRLEEHIDAWKAWSRGADTSEDGWETDFPQWNELAAACKEAMLRDDSEQIADQIGFCWKLAEESEEFADFARAALPLTRALVERLTSHEDTAVRWQSYDVLGSSGDAQEVLGRGLRDPVAYVRRRALLALARLGPVAPEVLSTMTADPDPYVRKVALELAPS